MIVIDGAASGTISGINRERKSRGVRRCAEQIMFNFVISFGKEEDSS